MIATTQHHVSNSREKRSTHIQTNTAIETMDIMYSLWYGGGMRARWALSTLYIISVAWPLPPVNRGNIETCHTMYISAIVSTLINVSIRFAKYILYI
ncbi:hypothetical protein PoB_002793700 [Plakobranchus ocellatus]|uniref:Odorant receptor n=1 Tax=Plakobranchus ocellatus TaxID=259542 RepID=A0AAV4A295_9GAST|nr:hypothetical protein PoB_002793700 [Plakobranchus ocellatus]